MRRRGRAGFGRVAKWIRGRRVWGVVVERVETARRWRRVVSGRKDLEAIVAVLWWC